MGDLNVKLVNSKDQLNRFTKDLLRDVKALEKMLHEGWFNTTPIHIGAEQEICLVDKTFKPAPVNMDVLERLDNDSFTTELAKFNIEANLSPHEFKGGCFSDLESEITGLLEQLRKVTDDMEIHSVLTGILPSIRKFDLGMENLTPLQRYNALIKAISKLRGKIYELRIRGIDELLIKHDSAMLEACNNSFQVHLQVTPDEFVDKYNIAQAICAPIVAISTNSPLLFGKRLWSETRVALFQQSIDTRLTSEHLRDRSPRVTFGNAWLKNSILDMYKEDIVRFRVMLMADVKENAFELMEKGETPQLKALNIHNSTVYRWNRGCYGISPNGRPHLRIENRVIPSGPSVLDEVSNAAFWVGVMNAFGDHYKDITKLMDFSDASSNFIAASRNGLDTEVTWVNGRTYGMSELIRKELLPIAREGLEKNKIKKKDIDKYLGVIEMRNETRRTGSSWLLNCYTRLKKESTREESVMALISATLKNQQQGLPIHEWEGASLDDIFDWHPASILVEEFMTTDLFTVHKDDILELVADIMDWQNIRYTLVEDKQGKLVGLVSARQLLRHMNNQLKSEKKESKTVQDLMVNKIITVSPDATITEAMTIMKRNKIGCLPVVKNHKLIGVVTESDFMGVASSLLARMNQRNDYLKHKLE